jgi:hypothetical protein
MNTLRSWHALGTWPFLLRMVGMGASAGVASWGLVFIIRRFVPDIPEPTGRLLTTAIFRGVVVGGALGIVLHKYWTSRAS